MVQGRGAHNDTGEVLTMVQGEVLIMMQGEVSMKFIVKLSNSACSFRA